MAERDQQVRDVAAFLQAVNPTERTTTWIAQQILDIVSPGWEQQPAHRIGDDLTPMRVRIEALDAAIRITGPDDWDGTIPSVERVASALARAEDIEAWILRVGPDPRHHVVEG